jgi:hypothetical protein
MIEYETPVDAALAGGPAEPGPKARERAARVAAGDLHNPEDALTDRPRWRARLQIRRLGRTC